MPGGSKTTVGYTKSAQKKKFIRNRDIKLKDRELEKEEKIQHVMVTGICKKCREKVQWKFKYDKYKPLKTPANCQICKQKTITKAYRTLCDGCAAVKDVCSSCCLHVDDTAVVDVEQKMDVEVAVEVVKLSTAEENLLTSKSSSILILNKTVATSSNESNTTLMQNTQDDVDLKSVDGLETLGSSTLLEGSGINWHEKKFQNIALSKYSKTRTIDTFNGDNVEK
jgi:hypothetical protein